MQLRALQTVFILGLTAGMTFMGTAPAQIAPGASPESQGQAAARPTHAVDLSRKNVLVLHGLESNVPIFELTDSGINTVLDSGGGAASETNSSNTLISRTIPVLNTESLWQSLCASATVSARSTSSSRCTRRLCSLR